MQQSIECLFESLLNMSFSIPAAQIVVKIIRKSDGKHISMNINENENRKVKFIKTHVKHLFHQKKKFHLYYKNHQIKSRHKLRYYGITSQVQNIEIIVA